MPQDPEPGRADVAGQIDDLPLVALLIYQLDYLDCFEVVFL